MNAAPRVAGGGTGAGEEMESGRWGNYHVATMSFRRSVCALLPGLLLGLWISSAAAVETPLVVTRQAPQVQRRYFDPAKPPKEMPRLKDDEAAVTYSQFGVGAGMDVEILNSTSNKGQSVATVKVVGINLALQLSVTIWLPNNPAEKLITHEEGHRRISEMYYQEAEKIATDLAKPFLGKTLRGEGKDPQAAADEAMRRAIEQINQRYMATTNDAAAKVQDRYDELTDHGRNKLDEDEAIRQAMKREK